MKGVIHLNNERRVTSKEPTDLDLFLKDFFLDPHTSYLDQQQFRIDLYETHNEMIVEALLDGYNKDHISVYVNDYQIDIKATMGKTTKQRSVYFPFKISNRYVHAVFQDGILEVFIRMDIISDGKNRFIPIK